MSALDAQVIIVGGGPAGSSTGFFLAQSGVDVMILDRARFPREKVCSEYLSPEASRILSAMGVLERVERGPSARLDSMIVTSPSRHTAFGRFVSNHGYRPFSDYGIAIRRTILDEILVRRAAEAGARLVEESRVVDLERDGGTVTGVRVSDGRGGTRILRANLVVGADGLRSIVARRIGVHRASRWPRRIAISTHYRGIRDIGSSGEIHVDRGGYSGFAPVGGGLTNFALVVPIERAGEIAGDLPDFLEEWIRSHSYLTPRFVGAERVTPVRATGPFAVRVKRAYAPGVALVGDAADFFDPVTGQGIYSALHGGEVLTPFILEALSVPARATATLRAYDAARKKQLSGKWRMERMLGRIVSSPRMMDRMVKILSRRRDLADLMVGVAGDFVPPREVTRLPFLLKLAFAREQWA